MIKIIGLFVCAICLILGYLSAMCCTNIKAEKAIFSGTFLENIITDVKIENFKENIVFLTRDFNI